MSAGSNLSNSQHNPKYSENHSDQLSLEMHSPFQQSVEKNKYMSWSTLSTDRRKWGPHVISYKFLKTKVGLEKKSLIKRSSELHYWWTGCSLKDALAKYKTVWGWQQVSKQSPIFLSGAISAIKENFTDKYRKTNITTGTSRGSVDLLKRRYYPMSEKKPTSLKL